MALLEVYTEVGFVTLGSPLVTKEETCEWTPRNTVVFLCSNFQLSIIDVGDR